MSEKKYGNFVLALSNARTNQGILDNLNDLIKYILAGCAVKSIEDMKQQVFNEIYRALDEARNPILYSGDIFEFVKKIDINITFKDRFYDINLEWKNDN